jgi:hypothetical protein
MQLENDTASTTQVNSTITVPTGAPIDSEIELELNEDNKSVASVDDGEIADGEEGEGSGSEWEFGDDSELESGDLAAFASQGRRTNKFRNRKRNSKKSSKANNILPTLPTIDTGSGSKYNNGWDN